MSKKIALIAVSFCLTAGPVFAGPMGGRAARWADASATTEKAPPSGEHMSDAQKSNVEALAKELKAIQEGSQVTEDQKKAMADSLMAIADTAHKPSQESVDNLVKSLNAAKADGEIAPNEAMRLAQDIAKVIDSSGASQEDVQGAIQDAQSILVASGVSKETAMVVAQDLQVIAKEVQSNVSQGKAAVEEATGGSTKKKSRRGRN